MEALFVIRIDQLDKFQTVSVIHSGCLGNFQRDIFLAGADCAVVQFVGIDDIDVR